MNDQKNDIKTYSPADIQKYLAGQLSASEMHAIEKAALDDPFLADAIEGFSLADSQTNQSNILDLKKRLEQRIEKEKPKRLIIPVWLKAAAVIGGIFISGLGVYVVSNNNNRKAEIAKKESTQAPANADTSAAAETSKTDSTTTAGLVDELKAEPVQRIPTTPTPAYKKAAKKPIAATAPAETESINDSFYTDKENSDVATSVAKGKVEPAPAIAQEEVPKSAERKISSFSEVTVTSNFSGRVLDNNARPVPGAIISAKNKKLNTVTDMNGFFNLSAPDTSVAVEINSVGFEKTNATLRNNAAGNNITLNAAEQSLNEVVVSGYGAKRSKDKQSQAITNNLKDVEPLVPWDEYDSYISSNKREPADEKNIDGEVIISFDVDEQHHLSNFKVEKSLSENLDKEAIRLIKEGPEWKPKKGKKAKARLAIKF